MDRIELIPTIPYDSLMRLNLNMKLLTQGRNCIRQLYDLSNSTAYNTFACDNTTCADCIRKWIERIAKED